MRQIWDNTIQGIRKQGDSEDLVNDCKNGVNECEYGILIAGVKSFCEKFGLEKFLDVVSNQQELQELNAVQGAMLVGLSIDACDESRQPQEGLLSQPSGLAREEPALTVLAREVTPLAQTEQQPIEDETSSAAPNPHWRKQGIHTVLHEMALLNSTCKQEAIIWALQKKRRPLLESWGNYITMMRSTHTHRPDNFITNGSGII